MMFSEIVDKLYATKESLEIEKLMQGFMNEWLIL